MTADPACNHTRTELVWAGKRTHVDRIALPFQRVETVNAPRGADLFTHTGIDDSWRNKLIWGDNKLVMASLLQGDPAAGIEPLAGKVDLIYIDPPFDTGADFTCRTLVGDEEIEKEPSALEHIAYRDTWGRGTDSYIQMMYDRLVFMKDFLSPTGLVCVHADYRVNRYIQEIMVEIFGFNNFVNEVIWKYGLGNALSKRNFLMKHDTISIFSKTEGYHFKVVRGEITPAQTAKYIHQDEIGLYMMSYGRKYYLKGGKPLEDVWDIPSLAATDSERLEYPTQKPERLIEPLISALCPENGTIADFFLGSGTTAAVAHKLGRRWIGCDLGRFAIHTSRKRLLDLGATFDVLNLGKYERSHWAGVTLPESLRAYVDFVLGLYRAEPVPGFKHIHGVKAGRAVHVGAVDAPVTFAEIADLIAECRATHTTAVDVLGWEWEMGVNQQAPQQAEAAGIDLRLYVIPNDVMDRRAKAADVKFYSLAYIEAEVRPVQARTVQVLLTDFIIPDLDLIPQALREKGNLKWSDYIDYWAVDFDYRDDTFRNAWQSFRTRARRTLDTASATHTYDAPGTYTVAVKVVDVFGIDSTKRLEIAV